MNTYDPADRTLYVCMTQEMDSYSTSLESGNTCCRLPVGYANRSSRTRLKLEQHYAGHRPSMWNRLLPDIPVKRRSGNP